MEATATPQGLRRTRHALDRFGDKALYAITGSAAVLALVIIALNLMAMRRRLWLPTAIAGRTIARADLQRMVGWGTPITQRIERYCRPRLPEMTESVGKVLVGAVIFVLGFIMILPIPFIGNMPPAMAATVIALGMTERDGLVVLIGLVVSVAAVVLASAATWAAVEGVIHYFTGA